MTIIGQHTLSWSGKIGDFVLITNKIQVSMSQETITDDMPGHPAI
jgi:hypothetical protein